MEDETAKLTAVIRAKACYYEIHKNSRTKKTKGVGVRVGEDKVLKQ